MEIKVAAASDIHGDITRIDPRGIDVFILAGDIFPTWRGRDREGWIEDQEICIEQEFIPLAKKFPNTDFVFVAGNHDVIGPTLDTSEWSGTPNIHYLQDSGCTVKGLKFWGSPWCPPLNGIWAFEAIDAVQEEKFALIPKGLDVLITHTPPECDEIDRCDIYDILTCKITRSPHLGSRALYDAICRTQPKYCFCGHVHTGDHKVTRIGATECFNVSMLDENYRLAYKQYTDIWDIKKEKKTAAKSNGKTKSKKN